MKIGSLFSGIGGLDLAAEAAFGGRTVWHCEIDRHAQRVLRRRWPDAELHADVRGVNGATVGRVDVLMGGFPCQDLSIAGKRAGLDGKRSGLYHDMLRIAGELRPEWVVFENVPPLLKYRSRVEGDLERMGYGSIWQVCEASDVGAPHRRQRVFVVARRGFGMHVMLPRPSPQRDLFVPDFDGVREDRLWPTPTICGNDNRKGASATSGDGLTTVVKAWPTPLADGDRAARFQQGGEPLGHAARWPTPAAADAAGSRRPPVGTTPTGRRPDGSKATIGLQTAAAWPTPTTQDGSNNGGPSQHKQNTKPLNASVGNEGVLNPAWVELLMGLPPGWTDPDCDDLGPHIWPAGRGEEQHAQEPPRLVPPKSVPNRGARLKALGNAVVWQQARAAIARAIEVAQ